ncbi:MAG: protein kinase domain-containing protein, partial [Sciscionella sp.]
MTSPAMTLLGYVLEGRYRIDGLIAHGGMSAVYRGLDLRLDREVAIKLMDQRFAREPAFLERFGREARSAARIHHPHVVAVHDQGVHRQDGIELPYLVMELVDGGTLRDLLNLRGSLDVALATAILEPVLAALAAAHRADLVHRDIKPENVLIGRGGVLKVGDFGLVRAVTATQHTTGNVILGTVAYTSPEQVARGDADVRSDVYSAGILLYEMLIGAPPFTGDTALSVAYRHVNEDVPAPGDTQADLPPAIDDLVLRATRRDPALRPPDGAAFLLDLQRVRRGLRLPDTTIPVPPGRLDGDHDPAAPGSAQPPLG